MATSSKVTYGSLATHDIEMNERTSLSREENVDHEIHSYEMRQFAIILGAFFVGITILFSLFVEYETGSFSVPSIQFALPCL